MQAPIPHLYLHASENQTTGYKHFLQNKIEGRWLTFSPYTFLFLGFHFAYHRLILASIVFCSIHAFVFIYLLFSQSLISFIYLVILHIVASFLFYPILYKKKEQTISLLQKRYPINYPTYFTLVESPTTPIGIYSTKIARFTSVFFCFFIFNSSSIYYYNYLTYHNPNQWSESTERANERLKNFTRERLLSTPIPDAE